jgi:ZIP family zinc transporter
LTALGAATVFFATDVNRKILDAILGLSGGVMLAASYWSLLAPAIEIAETGTTPSWLPPAIGFLSGGAVLWVFDKSLHHLHLGFPMEEAEGPSTAWQRAVLLVTATTIHNIPEGLAVGVAFGGIIPDVPSASLAAATALTIVSPFRTFPKVWPSRFLCAPKA